MHTTAARNKSFRVVDAKYPNKNLDLDQGQKILSPPNGISMSVPLKRVDKLGLSAYLCFVEKKQYF